MFKVFKVGRGKEVRVAWEYRKIIGPLFGILSGFDRMAIKSRTTRTLV